jgi:hypothetical protein
MKTEKKFATLDAFKKAAKLRACLLVKCNNPRIGEFWRAEIADTTVGSFCARYPKDSYLLSEADVAAMML